MKRQFAIIGLLFSSVCQTSCQEGAADPPRDDDTDSTFYFGADLSYVNQIVGKSGIYKDEGAAQNPYKIFKDHGANVVRLRLWHNPVWTKEVYDPDGERMYNDLTDVASAIQQSKEHGLQVLLDFHYSDNWADPGKQGIPKAWEEITSVEVLKDSVYQYTFKVLKHLNDRGLMPELVQLGNETNCGMLYTGAPSGFPACNVCDGGQWARLGQVLNMAIKAVNDVKDQSSIDTKILLHVADPRNVEWWFDNIVGTGGVIGFDIIGFSYYPLWHRTVGIDALSESVASFKSRFARPVMILETAYPWTTQSHDNYPNAFGNETAISGYPYTVEGQKNLLQKLTQEVKDGGGIGVVYWEPAWISVQDLKDQWGTGSSWENNTLFDFDGNALPSLDYMMHEYTKK